MNPEDLMITLDADSSDDYISPTTITLDDNYWSDIGDPRDDEIKSMSSRLEAIEVSSINCT